MQQSSKSSSNSSSNSQSSAPSTSKSSSSTSASLQTKTKDLSNILGPDGKLMPEEKAHHEKQGLCLYCGEKHATNDCPKKSTSSKMNEISTNAKSLSSSSSKSTSSTSSSSKPKGHTVQVISPVSDDSDLDNANKTSEF